jgi:glycosyltransferase involved in cell wall biosynthesis
VKILHLDQGREMRGGQWQVLRLMKGLAARGEETLLMAREDGVLISRARAAGLAVRPFSLLALPQLSRQFDLVHAHDSHSHGFAAMFPRVPIVVSRRVAFPVRKGFLTRRKYARADVYIAVSRYVANLLADGDIPEHKIEVVHDGVPLLPLTLGSGAVIALPLKDALQKSDLLARLPCKVRITETFESDLASASVLVYISDQEGLGSAVLLAMSAGVPVIASRVGGIPEIVEDGVDGILVDNTPGAICEAVPRLSTVAEEFGRRARAKIHARFSEARMVADTVNVYRKLLAHG